MRTDSKRRWPREEAVEFGPDTIEQGMRERVRATIEAIVEEEPEAALGAGRGARVWARHDAGIGTACGRAC